MSYYSILPHPPYNSVDFAIWEDGFNQEECNKIIRLSEQQNPSHSTIGSGNKIGVENVVRKSLQSWITLNSETEWLYNRLGNISRCLNGMHWRYDISGFSEDLQYTRYNEDSFYGWHTDSGIPTICDPRTSHPQRKLSLTLQLSAPHEYEGGDFQINATRLNTCPKEQGLVIVFPSHSLHQVTPVTKGIRRSLVVWLCGPPLR